ncbi:MAG: nitrogen fixation protein FixH [Burkholderiales bacterium 35-55-47]|nr:MAG: nitrogen fixation protein FixH [Burkholderiales bacterium 35-55-47]OYZ74488.1 MAG: nitrogen fixation protein FixH [Burkholderiales bacterium 24-55-52]OZB01622.1 MAG: nitrogen fixation protein FixH [Burkholderiales bacterium 39-55-53]
MSRGKTMKQENLDTKPWWKYGHVWLIISGPAAVIIAGFITLAIAIGTPDPVVADDYYRRGLDINKTLAAEKDLQLAPALQTRNHVVTPKPEATKP